LYFIAVWLAYCCGAFAVYRRNALAHFDGGVFSGLLLTLIGLAWLSYWYALRASPYLRPRSVFRECGIAVLSFAALFFSTWLWMFFAVNMYGEEHTKA